MCISLYKNIYHIYDFNLELEYGSTYNRPRSIRYLCGQTTSWHRMFVSMYHKRL